MGLIYMFENKLNGKKYIGRTTNILNRIYSHLRSNDQFIDKVIREKGTKNFTLKILERNIDKDKLGERERYWIDYYNTYKGEHYNLDAGGNGTTLYGEDNPQYGNTGEDAPMYGMSGTDSPVFGIRGEEHHRSKMSNEKRINIYNEYYKTNKTQEEVAKKYDVKRSDVSFIVTESSKFIQDAIEEGLISKNEQLELFI